MSKRQAPNLSRQRLAIFIRSLTPTWPERAMAAALLISLLAGAIVMHYRREYRLTHPILASPTPPHLPPGG